MFIMAPALQKYMKDRTYILQAVYKKYFTTELIEQ